MFDTMNCLRTSHPTNSNHHHSWPSLTYESSSSSLSDYGHLKGSSSSSSDGSGSDNFQSDGVSTNPFGRQQQRRRPSHRPRGCRGGKRNKKKQQQLELEAAELASNTIDSSSTSKTMVCNVFASMAASRSEYQHDDHFFQHRLGEETAIQDILPPPVIENCMAPCILQGPNPYALLTTPSKNVNDGEDYLRSSRIEKQRQMLADGGSLFLVSPRSFLLKGAERNEHTLWRN